MTPHHSRRVSFLVLAGYVAAAAVTALFGGYFTTKVTITTFYAALNKPVWAPPGWLFGPVWLLLYICMSLAMWQAWKNRLMHPARAFARAHLCWWVQLVLNAAWPVVFYLQPAGLAACVACVVLAVAVGTCLFRFWPVSRTAVVLMLPYMAWVSFASVLSFALWRMNSSA